MWHLLYHQFFKLWKLIKNYSTILIAVSGKQFAPTGTSKSFLKQFFKKIKQANGDKDLLAN